MTDREMKRLSRADLLELLLEQMRENEQLRAELEQVKEQLAQRRIAIDKAGSIAEASLKLNGVFEAAQAACAQYIQNIEWMNAQQKQRCAQMERETRLKCAQMVEEAKRQSLAYQEEAARKMQQLNDFYSDLSTNLRRTKSRR